MEYDTRNYRQLTTAGTLLGIGLGGFIDGILLHQVFQVHNMLSATVPKTSILNMEINMVWDGVFHLFTWAMTLAGIVMLWRAGLVPSRPWSGRVLTGGMFLGWGMFNLVEGVLNHHILHLHHVVERLGVSAFDYAFLGSGVLFSVLGWALIRNGKTHETPDLTSPLARRGSRA